jgi:hypothetical protein
MSTLRGGRRRGMEGGEEEEEEEEDDEGLDAKMTPSSDNCRYRTEL